MYDMMMPFLSTNSKHTFLVTEAFSY